MSKLVSEYKNSSEEGITHEVIGSIVTPLYDTGYTTYLEILFRKYRFLEYRPVVENENFSNDTYLYDETCLEIGDDGYTYRKLLYSGYTNARSILQNVCRQPFISAAISQTLADGEEELFVESSLETFGQDIDHVLNAIRYVYETYQLDKLAYELKDEKREESLS